MVAAVNDGQPLSPPCGKGGSRPGPAEGRPEDRLRAGRARDADSTPPSRFASHLPHQGGGGIAGKDPMTYETLIVETADGVTLIRLTGPMH